MAFRAGVLVARGVGRDLWGAARGREMSRAGFTAMTLDADDDALAREWLARPGDWRDGATLDAYQAGFARWNGSRHAYAFLGGRVALSAIAYALDLRPGDEVVVPGYTCVVVANALRWAGVHPVFADIELETYGLDAEQLEARLSSRTRAVLVHHLYGLVCRDFEAILEIARRRGLAVIEDCAHATGATWRGRRVGTWGDVAFYSSEASKVFCTVQGGIAATGDDALAERLRQWQERAPFPAPERTRKLLRTLRLRYAQGKHPQRRWWRHLAEARYGADRLASTTEEECRGHRPDHYGERLPAPLAAIGLSQLAKLDAYNRERRATAALWNGWCRQRGLATPRVLPESEPVFLRYPVLVEPARKRDLAWAQQELGFRPGLWFESQLHPAPEPVEGCPNGRRAAEGCINLPCLGVLPPR